MNVCRWTCLFHCQSLPSVLSNGSPSPSFLFHCFSPTILQVAPSLQPLPPHCSLHPSRRPRLPPTTHPPARLHRSGSARCPCWRKTPPTLTWSPTQKTHTCSVPSPPPRVRHLSSHPPVSLSFTSFRWCISLSSITTEPFPDQILPSLGKMPAILCFNLMSDLVSLTIWLFCNPLKSAFVRRAWNQTKWTSSPPPLFFWAQLLRGFIAHAVKRWAFPSNRAKSHFSSEAYMHDLWLHWRFSIHPCLKI